MAPTRKTARDRRQEILCAATSLFARQGFQGTKTKQIAEEAGINEAILFRHFPTKEELYWAVLDAKCRARRANQLLEDHFRTRGPEVKIFASLAEGILRRNTEDPSLLRLWLFSGLENHSLSRRFYRTYVSDYYEALAGHIRRLIREKKFRRVDPELAARAFLGMVSQHLLGRELSGGRRTQNPDWKQVSRSLAQIWLHGMHSSAAPRARGNRRR